MFCPKCDRVYLKAKVCPHCGAKLLRATGKPETKKIPQPHRQTQSLQRKSVVLNADQIIGIPVDCYDITILVTQ